MRPLAFASIVLLAGSLAAPVRAGSWESTFTVPDGLPATFELPFPVAHGGSVVIEATWTGQRNLFFGVLGTHDTALARRSGPSPQALRIEASGDQVGADVVWKLTVKALVARGPVSGTVKITVPDDPEFVRIQEEARRPPPPVAPPPPPWTVPAAAPAGATPRVTALYGAVEQYRAVVLKPVPIDACVWQQDFLKYATAARDAMGASPAALDVPTLRYFGRVASAVRAVDELRTSKDPVLRGPIPDDRDQRTLWLIGRSERVRPIERRLDELTELLRKGHAPALVDERWLPRMTACLTASERFFEERVRLGDDEITPNREVALAQWDRLLAAAGVLEAFGAFLPD